MFNKKLILGLTFLSLTLICGFVLIYPQTYISYFMVSTRNANNFKSFLSFADLRQELRGKIKIKDMYGRDLRVIIESANAEQSKQNFEEIQTSFLNSRYYDSESASPSPSLLDSNKQLLLKKLASHKNCHQIYLSLREQIELLRVNFIFRSAKNDELTITLNDLSNIIKSARCSSTELSDAITTLLLDDINQVLRQYLTEHKNGSANELLPYVQIGFVPERGQLFIQALCVVIALLILCGLIYRLSLPEA